MAEASMAPSLPAAPTASGGKRRASAPRVLLRLLAGALVTVVVASFLISAALALSPGDPVTRLLGPRPTPKLYHSVEHKLGLDQPFLERYADWAAGAVHGDFGDSITLREPVGSLIGPRLATTALLVAYAAVLIAVFGVGLGLLGGASSRLGPLVAVLSGIGVAIPAFVAAGLLVTFFALDLGLFPTIGAGTGFLNRLWHLTLPAISLALAWGAYVSQITRTAIVEEGRKDHIEAARSRGLPSTIVFRRHTLRNAAIPIVTVLGLTFAGLVAGAAIVETAFQINGIGSLLVTSIQAKDQNTVLATSMMLVLVFVVVTALIDLAAYLLDPRERMGGGVR